MNKDKIIMRQNNYKSSYIKLPVKNNILCKWKMKILKHVFFFLK